MNRNGNIFEYMTDDQIEELEAIGLLWLAERCELAETERAEFKRALEGVLPYAENEAEALHSLRDSDEAEAEAEVASRAVEYAQELIARAGGVT